MPRVLKALLDDRIRVDLDAIPEEAAEALMDALCIPNLERENAMKQFQHGAEDLPEEIVMYGLTEMGKYRVLDMPRGFAADFVDGMEQFGVEVEFDDQRSKPQRFPVGAKIEKREHQEEPVNAILEHQQGIYKAPPGAGKTVVVLAAGRKAATQCLIVVNTKDILRQWVNRIHEHLSDTINVGIIGGGKVDIQPYWNVATAQTLHSRREELLEAGFFSEFGFVCLDESHHATAETYGDIMDLFDAEIRIGVSATPGKTGDFTLAQLVLGPVFTSTSHKELVERGYLIKPKIVRVKTEFGYDFRGTTSRHSRSNYPEMVKAIIANRPRNEGIVGIIVRESGHHMLVLTKRHEHIDILEAMLWQAGYEFPIERLTGKEKNVDRERVIKMLESEPCCVFSTVADEALDVPRIDRGILAFPQKNDGLIEQQIGRFARPHPEKEESIVYDIADLRVGAFKAQWRARLYKVYKKLHLDVVKAHIDDFREAVAS